MLRSIFTSVLALAGIATAQNYPGPGVVTGATTAHDPTVVKNPDGLYILAVTAPNIGLKTSTDRTAWTDAGVAFPNGAPWTNPYTAGDPNLWAPDISFHNGLYYMYYSASSFGSQKSAIFLATSRTGRSGEWENKGIVIESSAANDFNAIDANLLVDGSRWYLSLGSFWSGIKLIDINPATGLRQGNAITSIASRPSAGGAIEAPFIVKRGNFYYLWASFDKCCNGAASTYRIMVGRSTAVGGPYLDRNGVDMMRGGGSQVLAGHGNIHGTGHQAVFADVDGDVLVYHYYNNAGTALLGINLLRYEADWPVVY